jgi:hypothetical protein
MMVLEIYEASVLSKPSLPKFKANKRAKMSPMV